MIEARDVRMGQYGHSNQVSHHILYMYNYAGQPWKTQDKVREVLVRTVPGQRDRPGLPRRRGQRRDVGLADLQRARLLSAAGRQPLLRDRLAAVHQGHRAPGERQEAGGAARRGNSPSNVYVQSLKVNGKPYDKTWLPHDLLARGAELDFEMGPEPSPLGHAARQRAALHHPRSERRPQPLRDATGPGAGHHAQRRGEHGRCAALFDDTSATRVAFTGAAPWLQYALQRAARSRQLLHADLRRHAGRSAGLDPEGLGATARTGRCSTSASGRAFPWRRYTRPFKVARPGAYAHYRLEVTENSGEPSTSLAELELLTRPVRKPSS